VSSTLWVCVGVGVGEEEWTKNDYLRFEVVLCGGGVDSVATVRCGGGAALTLLLLLLFFASLATALKADFEAELRPVSVKLVVMELRNPLLLELREIRCIPHLIHPIPLGHV